VSPPADPIARLVDALSRARAASPNDPTAAALATADARGRPSVRTVLVKGADARGLSFFTHRGSRKGRELAENPWAALCLHWPELGEQERAEGAVEPLGDAESDAYFATRPRESQLGAWASRQSAELASRAELEDALRAATERFEGEPVPRPPGWGGYVLRPDVIEFWRSAPARLHHRERYLRTAEGWTVALLGP
jgi:pyridoxamine 5'-phosphate oxidase